MNPTELDEDVIARFIEMKEKFYQECAKAYPKVRYPEMCWLFDQVLHIDPTNIPEAPITKTTYKSFVRDPETNKYLLTKDKTERVRVTRKFSDKQRKLVKEWWDLLPEDMKY